MRVTVIIPLYNKRKFIDRCLQSVLIQTKRPDRIIVVDDASTDGSAEVVRTMSDESVELVRMHANAGPGAARNVGARLAQTEWLAFLDADDEWGPTFLEKVTSAIAQTGADCGSSGRTMCTDAGPAGESVRKQFLLNGTGGSVVDLTADFWRIAQRFMPICSSSVVVSRSLYEEVGDFPEDVRRFEDFAVWTKLWLNGTIAFVNEPLCSIHKNKQGLSAGRRLIKETYRFQGVLTTTLMRAIVARKSGTFWLMLFHLRFLALSNASLIKRSLAGLMRSGARP